MSKLLDIMEEIEEISEVADKAKSGRISIKKAEKLYSKNLHALALVADGIRKKAVGNIATFVTDININYTNVCISKCSFCAFYRDKSSKNAYVLSVDEILKKVEFAKKFGVTQVLIQGGLNPDIEFEFYEEVIRRIKERFPDVFVHAFSPIEIYFFAKNFRMSIREVLERFKDAGLRTLPGGGAEILVEDFRKKVSPNKPSSKAWLEVMETAHKLGIKTSATMVIGLGESVRDRIEHIIKIRKLQEKTKGFVSFIPWSFKSGNTALKRDEVLGIEYLKTVAISRILLNGAIKNIQASWITQGTKIAQIALFHGANDIGGVNIEENVVKATGADVKMLPKERIIKLIREANRIPAERNTIYEIIRYY